MKRKIIIEIHQEELEALEDILFSDNIQLPDRFKNCREVASNFIERIKYEYEKPDDHIQQLIDNGR